MKDTCKQAIFRKDNKGAKRVRDLLEEEIKIKGGLEFFNALKHLSMFFPSEFMAAQQAVEQIIHLYDTLCMLGVLFEGTSDWRQPQSTSF